MTTTVLPTVVIVPGSWCPAAIWDPVTSRLLAAGYKVHALDLPSRSPYLTRADGQADIEVAAHAIKACADRGEDIVVVMHSAGAVVVGNAAIGLSKQDRTKGNLPGGITHLVYIAAFVPDVGTSLATLRGANLRGTNIYSWVIRENQHGQEVDFPDPAQVHDVFFNDMSLQDPEALRAIALFSPQTVRSRYMEVSYAPWKDIPSTYMLCERDNANPLAVQQRMIEQPGATFDVVRCDCGHYPSTSRPDVVVEVVKKAAGESQTCPV